MNAEWTGPMCLMCAGTGRDYSYRATGDPDAAGCVPVVRDMPNGLPCRACNGHGRDAEGGVA